ncbi:MAG: HAD hydrolase family protein [Bdellovibrionaceae bacterium]|jgi:3-deoxy-D-manno-octulosonate 8-phosphate phosphatase (KDO 8-P phosphatase)|nr:HAD hydrolase family protein [Pseudobdellovibrionaceae bacterium]
MNSTIEQAKKFEDKLKKIKVFLSDVDGILTTGLLYYAGEEMGYNRFFHTHDGYGLKILMNAGIKCGIISGGGSKGVKKRFEDLGLDYIFLANEDKREAYRAVLNDGYKPEEIIYIGDEFFDLPILKDVGFSATVPSASFEIQEQVDYVTQRDSGTGCVREVIDMLRYVQKITPKIAEL